jgi:hypothetical protein
MVLRPKVQICMPWDVHSMAKTPPLAAFNVALESWWDETVQPMYEFANCSCVRFGRWSGKKDVAVRGLLLTAQSLVRSVPDWPEPAIVQFGSDDECRDMMFGCWLLVCSKMSISPVAGQTPVPTNQNAGQVPHLMASQHD